MSRLKSFIAIWLWLAGSAFAQPIVVEETVQSPDIPGVGIVIGHQDADAAEIGMGSVLLSGSTSQPNELIGTSYLRMIFGGYDNSIVGDLAPGGPQTGGASAIIASHHSHIVGSSSHTFVLNGSDLTAEGHYSGMLGGTQGNLLGNYSGMLPGLGLDVDADFALARGRDGIVTADHGEVRGRDGVANLQFGATVGVGAFSNAGDAQATDVIRKVEATSCTWTPMQTLVMPPFTVWAFDIMIAGRAANDNIGAAYQIKGAIRKSASNGSTTFIGSPAVTVLGEDSSSYDARAVANASSGGLQVQVSCAARWVASYRLTEVSGLN